jgi:hypothetical protein
LQATAAETSVIADTLIPVLCSDAAVERCFLLPISLIAAVRTDHPLLAADVKAIESYEQIELYDRNALKRRFA